MIDYLRQRLQQPLPGLPVQMDMSSRPERAMEPVREDYRESAVLALIYPHEGVEHIVFMQRPTYHGVHSGQVSFPGGRREAEDFSLEETALREAEEELGIPRQEVELLGSLSPLYIPPSNFMVYPKVGYMAYRPDFIPSEREVAKVIEVAVSDLLKPETRQLPTIRLTKDMSIEVPAFIAEGHIIWGATAMMLNELLYLLREPNT